MSSKSKWESFFTDAGIPLRQATEYAITFANNRMRLDMLDELNKELLRDLGIKALGDIITILRYAKQKECAINRSPTPESVLSHAKSSMIEKVKSSVSLPTNVKMPSSNTKSVNRTVAQKVDMRNKPPVKTTNNVKLYPSSNRMGVPTSTLTNRIGLATSASTNRVGLATSTSTNRVGPATSTSTNRIGHTTSTLTNRIGLATSASTNRIGHTTGTSTNQIGHATNTSTNRIGLVTSTSTNRIGPAASSARINAKPVSATKAPRMRLSERFDGFQSEAKKPKLEEKGILNQIPEAKNKYAGVEKTKSIPEVKVLSVEERFKTRLSPNVSGPVNSKAEKRDLVRPAMVHGPVIAKLSKDPAEEKPVQFTVQVPSKLPGNASVTSDSVPKVTVVPARGKALNRINKVTSIFDRLDAPSSSSVAVELLNEEPVNSKNNVFKRLGGKLDEPKTDIEKANVDTVPSIVLEKDKHGPESVFKRLGTLSDR